MGEVNLVDGMASAAPPINEKGKRAVEVPGLGATGA